MKVLSEIERALKRLYNLDSSLQVQDFLVQKPLPGTIAPGALYVCTPDQASDDLNIGVFLHSNILEQLALPSGESWSGPQLAAFGVAAEEISHFHYIAHHAPQGRGISQLELELQGDIDRFLLTFFAQLSSSGQTEPEVFEPLFEKLFESFTLVERLTSEQKERYLEANRVAKAFLNKNASDLKDRRKHPRFLKLAREFYRRGLADKINQSTR
ncbi:hypothetical protein K2X33_05190 [bacterium]|nr:hypothetical protein [bacterium]